MKLHLFLAMVLLSYGAAALAAAQAGAKPQNAIQPDGTTRPSGRAPVPVPRTAFIAEMDAEFGVIDADKNKILTVAEIEQFQRMANAREVAARNRGLFIQLDADKNGQISPTEFARLQAKPQPPNAAAILSRADLNKDRSVTLVEYRTAKLANFDRTDTDKDGIVSVAEMRAAGIIK